MAALVEIVHRDPDNVFLRRGRLLVQVRRGPISVEVIDHVEAAILKTILDRRAPAAFVAVLEASAPTAPPEVRKRQRQLVRTTSDADLRMALVVLGDGVQPMLTRTIGRAILHFSSHLRVVPDMTAAARWVAPHLDEPSSVIVGVIQRARSMLTLQG